MSHDLVYDSIPQATVKATLTRRRSHLDRWPFALFLVPHRPAMLASKRCVIFLVFMLLSALTYH